MPDLFDTKDPTPSVEDPSNIPHDDGLSESSSPDEHNEGEHSSEEGDKKTNIDPNRRPRDESPNSRRVSMLVLMLMYS